MKKIGRIPKENLNTRNLDFSHVAVLLENKNQLMFTVEAMHLLMMAEDM